MYKHENKLCTAIHDELAKLYSPGHYPYPLFEQRKIEHLGDIKGFHIQLPKAWGWDCFVVSNGKQHEKPDVNDNTYYQLFPESIAEMQTFGDLKNVLYLLLQGVVPDHERLQAFASVTHDRLGQSSCAGVLTHDLVKLIASFGIDADD